MKRVVSFAAVIGVLVILTGLLIFVNTRQDTVQYSREELKELFERYPVATLQKEFAEKSVVLSNPNSEKDFQMLIEDHPISDSKNYESAPKAHSTINFCKYHYSLCSGNRVFCWIPQQESVIFICNVMSLLHFSSYRDSEE